MRDVAALAGVSLSSVSRVLSGGEAVDPALAARVREAVGLLGYRRNHTASSLRRADRQTASIGIAWEDVSNPFFSAVQRGIEEVARQHGVMTLVGSSDEDPDRERALVEAFCSRGVDGLIIAPTTGDQSYLERDRALGMAIVFVDRPPRFLDADSVVSDNAGGTDRAVSHLIAGGHRRIAFLGGRPDIYTTSARLGGYRTALARANLPHDPRLVRHARRHRVGGYETAIALLRGPDPPSALFTSQNLVTVEAVRALHDLGLQRRVALVGFDDIVLADSMEPGLTVVAQDAAAIGRAAAELLFSRIGGYAGATRQLVAGTTLIERGSGELPVRT
jgi:LacI family transcriptional regulator